MLDIAVALNRLTKKELPNDFRVIDVHSMSIVRPSMVPRFVTLSYMWPEDHNKEYVHLRIDNVKQLEVPGSLAKIKLPKLIIDAITLCREIGEAYTWIDSLSIVQDDAASKHSQISAMDKIYHAAILCVIAALDDREDLGLPGCSTRARASSVWRPRIYDDWSGRLDLIPHTIHEIVNPSLWNTRGWTFQERLFSKRRLFITEFQVFYECSLGSADESPYWQKRIPLTCPVSLEIIAKNNEVIKSQASVEIPGFRERAWEPRLYADMTYSLTKDATLENYFGWVENYSTRQLSFGSDRLNAFAG